MFEHTPETIQVFFSPCDFDSMEDIPSAIQSGIKIELSIYPFLNLPQNNIKKILRYLIQNDVRNCENIKAFYSFIEKEADFFGLFDPDVTIPKCMERDAKRVAAILKFWDAELKKNGGCLHVEQCVA